MREGAGFGSARAGPAAAPRGQGGWRAFHEGAQHRAAKAGLAAALRSRGLDVTIEAPAGAARRADLLVRSPAGSPVAIEIQHSAITLAEVRQRTADHAAAGLATLWLPVLTLPAGAVRPVRGAGGLFHLRTALPAWLEWLEARAGALWFWRDGALWRGWIAPAWVRSAALPSSDPLDCGWRLSRRLRTLTLQGPFPPGATRLLLRPACTGPDIRFAALPGPCATLVVAGERQPAPCPTAIEWVDAPGGVRPVVRLAGAGSALRH